jgi:hypothetical protein
MTGMAMLLKQLIPEDALQQIGKVLSDVETFKQEVIARADRLESKLDNINAKLDLLLQQRLEASTADFSPEIVSALREFSSNTIPAAPTFQTQPDDPELVSGCIG